MKPWEFLEEYYEKKKLEAQLPQQEKNINYWKNNCEEDYMTTPISVLRYISELEKLVPQQETLYTEEQLRTAMKYASEITNNKMKYMEDYIQSLNNKNK